jgi:hypothetical protein
VAQGVGLEFKPQYYKKKQKQKQKTPRRAEGKILKKNV